MRKCYSLFCSTILGRHILKQFWISISLSRSLADVYSALEKAKEQDFKGEPDFSYLNNIKVAVSIIHLLSAYVNTALLPLASSSLTIRRDMTKYFSTNLSMLEKKVNGIFQATHDSET